MPVLTKSEYKKKKTEKEEKIKQVTPSIKGGDKPVIKKIIYNYVLFHPENVEGSYQNFDSEVNISGVDLKYSCINGTVKTDSDVLASKLISDGYHIISKELKDE